MKKTRPILFSTPMVQALLSDKKTQTRRIIKPQPTEKDGLLYFHTYNNFGFMQKGLQYIDGFPLGFPYGRIGDLLYVRESFGYHYSGLDNGDGADRIIYKADNKVSGNWELKKGWKPSIHMPRDFSRLTLEIVDVRVERLQDISEKDAIAEGIKPLQGGAKSTYAMLWDSINGKDSWRADPWVWVIEFKVHKCNFKDLEEPNNGNVSN